MLPDTETSLLSAQKTILRCVGSGGRVYFVSSRAHRFLAMHLAEDFVSCAVPAFYIASGLQLFLRAGDVVIGIASMPNSAVVLKTLSSAREIDCVTIGFASSEGYGLMKSLSDILFVAPTHTEFETEEWHLGVGHALCNLIGESTPFRASKT